MNLRAVTAKPLTEVRRHTADFGETLEESNYRRPTSKDLLTDKPYKAMLERDKTKKKLSEELRARLIRGE